MISSRRWTGSRPVRARISATMAGRSRWATWRAERLTEMSSGRASGRCSCHSSIWRQARSCTQRPIGSIRPHVLGDRDELVRVEQAAARVLPAHQRLQAGDLAGAQRRRPAGSAAPAPRGRDAWRSSRSISSRRTALARISASNSSQRARPRSLARYIAASASRISRSALTGSRSAGRATAIPMLAVTKCSVPPIA